MFRNEGGYMKRGDILFGTGSAIMGLGMASANSSGMGEVIAIASVIIGAILAAFAYSNMKLSDERRKTDRRVKEIRRKVA